MCNLCCDWERVLNKVISLVDVELLCPVNFNEEAVCVSPSTYNPDICDRCIKAYWYNIVKETKLYG